MRIVNSAIYAMQILQKEPERYRAAVKADNPSGLFLKEMEGEAECADLTSDDDVMALVKELRSEDENV